MAEPAPCPAVLVLAASTCVAALALHGLVLAHPVLVVDDFQILVRSWTWPAAVDNLWVPANEHAMPLGRLTTWALTALAGRVADVPRVLLAQGPLAVVLGLPLLYLFVRRELGHPLYGLVAMALFGLSTVYQQAVFWFSSSFSILSLDMTLLALLAAQAWLRTGRPWHLLAAAGWAALAPGWFAIGILAGPLCCLYLLPFEGDQFVVPPSGGRPAKAGTTNAGRAVHLLATLVPALGSVAFLAVSLPRTAERILHLPHYEGKTAVEAFHLLPGLENAGRSVVDNLALGVLGVSGLDYLVCPRPLAFVVLALLAAAGVWWWRGVRQHRLMLLGLGCIFLSYVLVYGARSEEGWYYLTPDGRGLHTWSRYHLFPQLGLALFVCGGLPRWQGSRLRLDPAGALSRRQFRWLAGLVVVLFLTQAPRGVVGCVAWTAGYARQQEVLRQIDAVDARCRRLHIGRDTAVQALPFLDVPDSGERENGWLLLRGSPDPRPVTAEDARRLLEDGGPGS
jgi:hypothetical protein